jgi:hypothetical protein
LIAFQRPTPKAYRGGGLTADHNSARFGLSAGEAIERIGIMKLTKNIGMLLLAVYLILDALLGFGLNIGPAVFLLYLVALAAGIFILIGK